MRLEQLLVYHGAPTLAGLKIANLISIPEREYNIVNDTLLIKYNSLCNSKGIYFQILCSCKNRYLLYVYNKEKVERYIKKPESKHFLSDAGYEPGLRLETQLIILSARFKQKKEFPHELGIFLGYPVADVKKFIQFGGNQAKICGEWKVYTNVNAATETFRQYSCCRQDYLHRYNLGYSLLSLIVA
ncbi:DUF3793 family protein [Megasphaera paucivorans]|uniref:DUF3793 family protein n=1 Tax=Megasphaera paucivorans TaxID=349095 RepID=A0A1G9VIX6_9FIRM|nr:DUF3793 family protein [Megasphaera paucivorans]SDM72056.1 Protein of unknown function [Megasphaera paucivorans]